MSRRHGGVVSVRPHTVGDEKDAGVKQLIDLTTDALAERILREPLPAEQGLALWLPGPRRPPFQEWERIRSRPQAEFTLEAGIGAVPATMIRAYQPLPSWWGRLRQWVQPPAGSHWTLPNGAGTAQGSERQADALLVWAEADGIHLDEAWLRKRWPQASRIQKLGKKLFLVAGVVVPTPERAAQLAQVTGCPRQQAEEALAAARRHGERWAEAVALTDLALIELNQQQPAQAIALLTEALQGARGLGERALEADILTHLGQASLEAHQPQQAAAQLRQALAAATGLNDRFLEKLVLERLGHAYRHLGQRGRCLETFQQARTIAQELGHPQHEAELLWLLAIVHAESGDRERALDSAQATVQVLERAGLPQAAWYAEHVRRYRGADGGDALNDRAEPERPGGFFGGLVVTATRPARPAGRGQGPAPAHEAPGLLRMAVATGQAIVKFLGSGLRTLSRPEVERRLRTCAACPHHTGLRCRLCGCFTNAKARLPHEDCPLAKW